MLSSFNDMVYISCWGGCSCLFLQYNLQISSVFTTKTSKIYILTILGLCMCYLESCLTMISVFTRSAYAANLGFTSTSIDPLTMWYAFNIPMNVVWFLMVQIVTWLYVYRVQSLGTSVKVDKYLKYVPFIIGIFQLPNVVINLTVFNSESGNQKSNYFIVSSSILSVCITFVELSMFTILLQKLNAILEFKPVELAKVGMHLKINCAAVMGLQIIMAIVRFFVLIDFAVSPLIYLLRIYIIIQLYSDVLVSIDREYKTTLDSNLSSYLLPRNEHENASDK